MVTNREEDVEHLGIHVQNAQTVRKVINKYETLRERVEKSLQGIQPIADFFAMNGIQNALQEKVKGGRISGQLYLAACYLEGFIDLSQFTSLDCDRIVWEDQHREYLLRKDYPGTL